MSDFDNTAAAAAITPQVEEPELEEPALDEDQLQAVAARAEEDPEPEAEVETPSAAAAAPAAPVATAVPAQSPAIDDLPKTVADRTVQAHVIWYPDGRIAVGVSDGLDAPVIKGYHDLSMNQVVAAISQMSGELTVQFDKRREAAVERLKKAATPPSPPRSVPARPASKPASKPAAAPAAVVPAKPAAPPLPSLFDFTSL